MCTGKCWKQVSGGETDGTPDTPYYTYGGMWKNKVAGVSAKKPKKRQSVPKEWTASSTRYTTNDRIQYNSQAWICRRSHISTNEKAPGDGYTYWKEDESAINEQIRGSQES